MGGGGGAGGDDSRKQNHCEIEKRRRDKMNHYITELASVIPSLSNNQSKLDKLTVLRMAVQHVKSLRSSLCSFSSLHLRPSFLSSGNLLKNLILRMAEQESHDTLLMVVTCDRGKVLFVSNSSRNILNQDQNDMVGQSLFDILHKDDVSKVKEQITHYNLVPKKMLVDSKTLQPIKNNRRESYYQSQNQVNSTLQPGSRRSFFCRMKSGRIWQSHEKSQQVPNKIGNTRVNLPATGCSNDDTTGNSMSCMNNTSDKDSDRQSRAEPANELTSNTTTKSTSTFTCSSTCSITKGSNAKQISNGKSRQNQKQLNSHKHPHHHYHHNHHHHNQQQQHQQHRQQKAIAKANGKKHVEKHHSSDRNIASELCWQQRDFDKLSTYCNAVAGQRFAHDASTKSISSRSTMSSSGELNRSSDSGISSIEQMPKKASHMECAQRTPATTTTAPIKKTSIEINLPAQQLQELDSDCGPTSVMEFGIGDRCANVANKLSSQYSLEPRRENAGSVHGQGASDKQVAAIIDCGIISHEAATSTTTADISAQTTSTSTNESSPLSTSSSPSSSLSSSPSISSSFSSSEKNNNSDKDGARCKTIRAHAKPHSSLLDCVGGVIGGAGSSDAAASQTRKFSHTTNGLGGGGGAANTQGGNVSISFNRKQWRYIVMHCTGYLKSLYISEDEYDDDDDDSDFVEKNMEDDNSADDEKSSNEIRHSENHFKTVNCLVAVCRRSVMDRYLKPDKPLTFTCRYSMEGKFIFVDQRTTIALGYMPQQLLGTSHYAYCHEDSVKTFKECHRQCILKPEPISSDVYQFKRANGQSLWLQTSLKSFRNPWTKLIDYIVANHTTAESIDSKYNEGCVPTKFNQDMTGETSQSSSPASSTSISCPDSKKSGSLSSSSIVSSNSIDSYASGANVQVILNRIDSVKSGGLQHPFKLKKHHADGSSDSSARKSNDDSGNYSDLQSCSSISSQNSGTSSTGGYSSLINGVSNFGANVNANNQTSDCGQQHQQWQQQQQHQLAQQELQEQPQMMVASEANVEQCQTGEYDFDGDRRLLNVYQNAQDSCNQAGYQQQPGCVPATQPSGANNQQVCDQNDFPMSTSSLAKESHSMQFDSLDNFKGLGGPRMFTARLNRPPINSTSAIKPLQRPYQCFYRSPQERQTNLIDIHNNQQLWLNAANLDYANQAASNSSRRPNSPEKASMDQSPITSGSGLRTEMHMLDKVPQDSRQASFEMHLKQQVQLPVGIPQTRAPQTAMDQSMDNYGAQIHVGQFTYPNSSLQTNQPQPTLNHFRIQTNQAHLGHYPDGRLVMGQALNRHQRLNNHLQEDLASMTIDQQKQEQEQQQQQTSQQQMTQSSNLQNDIDMSIPIVWNSNADGGGGGGGGGEYQSSLNMGGHRSRDLDVNQVEGSGGNGVNMIDINAMESSNQLNMVEQVSNNQCQQCANHRCYNPGQNQPLIINNNGDLNSMHLSSLAVDDLDEGELLECLAACEPQLYNIQQHPHQQGNTYSNTQYNIYRGQ